MDRLRAGSPTGWGRLGGRGLLCLFALLICASPLAATPHNQLAPERLLIVAIAEKPDPPPIAGSTPRGYGGLPNYSGSLRSIAGAARLAKDYGLREVSAWTIQSLRLRCMLYELPSNADHEEMLTRLRQDDRVRLVQPLQSFDTLTTPSAQAMPDTAATATRYNDPYIGLQRGFTAIGADQAQRWSSGSGVRIALIDSGVDVEHPDLRGRIALARDFVGDANAPAVEDRHGTQIAGVIAAVANNRIGIAGVAPGARLYAYRACWSTPDSTAARCNSFTLALALDAAIGAGARIINLSLGGPADPLLEQLVHQAIERGTIVIGALPGSGRLDGFPLNVPGVIAVADTDAPPASARTLGAPGREILTLEPGGHYDYASGSSLAAAHVSGSIALLLQLDPRLRGSDAIRLLGDAGASIDVCAAVQALHGAEDRCRPAEPILPQHARR